MEINPAQCRAARALVNWTQDRLAAEAEVAKKTIADFEREIRQPYPRTVAALRTALEAVGVEFTDGDAPGVRLRPSRDGAGNGSKLGRAPGSVAGRGTRTTEAMVAA